MRVLVLYEPSAGGRAALAHARSLARDADAALTVTVIAAQESTTLGCATSRKNAVVWNRLMGEVAAEALAEAADFLHGTPDVDFEVLRGERTQALLSAAARVRADLIVLPRRPYGALGRIVSVDLAGRLRAHGMWTVLEVPPAHRSPLRP